jgi:hypothetical protein
MNNPPNKFMQKIKAQGFDNIFEWLVEARKRGPMPDIESTRRLVLTKEPLTRKTLTALMDAMGFTSVEIEEELTDRGEYIPKYGQGMYDFVTDLMGAAGHRDDN